MREALLSERAEHKIAGDSSHSDDTAPGFALLVLRGSRVRCKSRVRAAKSSSREFRTLGSPLGVENLTPGCSTVRCALLLASRACALILLH